MTARPLPLRAWQVSAALDDRLSVLVVALKPQPEARSVRPLGFVGSPAKFAFTLCQDGGANSTAYVPLPLSVGDRLWAREAAWICPPRWTDTPVNPMGPDRQEVAYKADDRSGYTAEAAADYKLKLRSATQLPRWASRLTLDVTEVRVCRLQDVTEDEARAMGSLGDHPAALVDYWVDRYGRGSWGRNDWVAVARVEVHHRNIDSLASRGNQCVASNEKGVQT